MLKKTILILQMIVIGGLLSAQNFGFDDNPVSTSTAPITAKIGGGVETRPLMYVHDFSSAGKAKISSLGDMVSAKVNFSASGANADAYIGLNLSATRINDLSHNNPANITPLIFDEAYVRAFFGPVNIEAGYRKMFWGRADSLGPLDVINPLDYSDLTNISDIKAMKIARPLVHATWNLNGFSKLEAVFVPDFEGHSFDRQGRWIPSEFSDIPDIIGSSISSRVIGKIGFNPTLLGTLNTYRPDIETKLMNYFNNVLMTNPESTGLGYFQTGLRYTTSVGGMDIGAQYYYGYLPRPAWHLNSGIDGFVDELYNRLTSADPSTVLDINPALLNPYIGYNRFHQIGVDYAQVLSGFNIRAEFSANITNDLTGTDGAVQNPFLAWSAGFDRDIIAGITGNIQCGQTIRLLNNKISNDPIQDFEANTNQTSTRLTMIISRNFLKDNLEAKITAIWDIEESGYYLIPAVTWTIKDVKAGLSAGIFGGKESSELGQYWDNSFIKLTLAYSF